MLQGVVKVGTKVLTVEELGYPACTSINDSFVEYRKANEPEEVCFISKGIFLWNMKMKKRVMLLVLIAGMKFLKEKSNLEGRVMF